MINIPKLDFTKLKPEFEEDQQQFGFDIQQVRNEEGPMNHRPIFTDNSSMLNVNDSNLLDNLDNDIADSNCFNNNLNLLT